MPLDNLQSQSEYFISVHRGHLSSSVMGILEQLVLHNSDLRRMQEYVSICEYNRLFEE